MINQTAHHGMLGPLETNVMLVERLLAEKAISVSTESGRRANSYLETILVASNLQLHHSRDLIDYRIIEQGTFQPNFELGSLADAVCEIVDLAKLTTLNTNADVLCDIEAFRTADNLEFDKRRFQQVLLNILTNALKF